MRALNIVFKKWRKKANLHASFPETGFPVKQFATSRKEILLGVLQRGKLFSTGIFAAEGANSLFSSVAETVEFRVNRFFHTAFTNLWNFFLSCCLILFSDNSVANINLVVSGIPGCFLVMHPLTIIYKWLKSFSPWILKISGNECLELLQRHTIPLAMWIKKKRIDISFPLSLK